MAQLLRPIPEGSGVTALVVKFDGIDGCGKSTLCQSVAYHCSKELRVFCTSEFGSANDIAVSGVAINLTVSQMIRDFALKSEYECDDIERQLLLNAIGRRANRLVIAKQARAHDLVIVDRSHLSNLAYGVPLDARFRLLANLANEGLDIADMVFWIDTPLTTCAERLGKRAQDQVEQKGENYQAYVREQFQNLTETMRNVARLDGSFSVEELTDQVMSHIYPMLLTRKESSNGPVVGQ